MAVAEIQEFVGPCFSVKTVGVLLHVDKENPYNSYPFGTGLCKMWMAALIRIMRGGLTPYYGTAEHTYELIFVQLRGTSFNREFLTSTRNWTKKKKRFIQGYFQFKHTKSW